MKEDVERALQKMPRIGNALTDRIRTAKDVLKRLLIPGMLFEDMGITYIGPIDGHDIKQMITAFRSALKSNRAVMVHVVTQKGKGYPPAQENPSAYHGVAPFFIRDGKERRQGSRPITYTEVFSQEMLQLGREHKELAAITAAMPSGTGLSGFAREYPDRFFDVGIAEEHAVTFAAGMAAGGVMPVVALYSTFLQRAYDQMIHDVCINELPVVFAVDRAGLVGSDGETHQGLFALSFLSSIPNMHVMAPKNKWELSDMLKFAVEFGGPIAIRYPRGEAFDGLKEHRAPIVYGKSEMLFEEKDILLLAVGSMVKVALTVRERLKEKGLSCSLVNARFVKPIDEELIREACKTHGLIVTMEENVASGGFGDRVRAFVDSLDAGIKVLGVAIPDEYVEHGNVELLKQETGIDAASVEEKVCAAWRAFIDKQGV